MPAFPFHRWMPDAYGTMPLPALASFRLLSTVAAYGPSFLRARAALFPYATHTSRRAWPEPRARVDRLLLDHGLPRRRAGRLNPCLLVGRSQPASSAWDILRSTPPSRARRRALQAVNPGLVGAAVLRARACWPSCAGGSGDTPRLRRDRVSAPRCSRRSSSSPPGRAGDARLGRTSPASS